MKRHRLFVTLLAGVLAMGIAAGTVLANGDGTESDSPLSSFASRVAAILGLDEAQVQDALKQAATEMRDEAVEWKLDRLIEQGRLTQEQADEYREWYQSRPEGLSPGLRSPGFGKHGFFGGQEWAGRGWHGKGFHNKVPQEFTPKTVEPTSS